MKENIEEGLGGLEIKVDEKKLLRKYDFNTASELSGWSLIDNNKIQVNNDIYIDQTRGHDYQGSLRIKGVLSNYPIIRAVSPPIPVKSSYAYIAEGWVLTDSLLPKKNRNGVIRMDFYRDNPGRIGLETASMESKISSRFYGTTSWIRQTIIGIAPEEARFLTVSIQLSTDGNLLYDDLMVYDKTGNRVSQGEAEELKNIYFKKYDANSYKNPFKKSANHETPVVQYYETEAYKNLPAVVPFDLKNGWYVAARQTLPTLGNIKSYDASGKVNNFYLCNVGPDGIEEFFSGIADDTCQQIFLESGKTYRSFPGLSESEAINLVESAVSAIEQASTARLRNPNLKIGDKIRINTGIGGSINVQSAVQRLKFQIFSARTLCLQKNAI